MSQPALFKQVDLVRALRAAEQAGVAVRVEIEPGRMVVIPIEGKPSTAGNSFDGMFA